MSGKGLEALIPQKGGKPTRFAQEKESVFLIEVERIKPNPQQPRKDFDPDDLKNLSDSIKEHGILQPLIVTKIERETDGGKRWEVEYELIAGERRLQAAKIARFSQVPVIVRKPTEQQKLELSLVENVQRANLNPIEEAVAFKRLMEEFNLLQKEVAQKMGKSRESIANTLRLLNLPLEIQKGIIDGKISEGHARAILPIDDPEKQRSLFEQILKDNLSVRKTEEVAHQFVERPQIKNANFSKEAYEELKEVEERLKTILKTKSLTLNVREGKPKLTIEFNSKKEIDELLEKIGE